MSRHDVRRPAVAFTLLTVLNLAVWSWSVRNGFVFDDLDNVLGNAWIKDWRLLPQAFLHHVARFRSDYSTSFCRPLMHVLYALAYGLAGARPWVFHLLNVALHTLAVLCVYRFARHDAGTGGGSDVLVPAGGRGRSELR